VRLPANRLAAVTEAGDGAVQLERVRRFYDRNSARFTALGQGGAAIHRAVHGPGVTTREQAFHHVEERILTLLPPGGAPRVVDLGCGVGGSLIHLACRRPDLTGEGLTISPAQAGIARRLLVQAGVDDRIGVREGDFLDPPAALAGADLAFSIEAFVHGPDPAAYFRAAAGVLRPGGRLVICDDLLTPAGAAPTGTQARRLAQFRAGWRVASLVTVEAATRLGAAAGLRLVSDDDLTPFLELRRPRDRWIAALVAAARPLPSRWRGEYWHSLAGGDALQRCLSTGLVGYRLLGFRRD
jgi:SAM-dependent methyltransferase